MLPDTSLAINYFLDLGAMDELAPLMGDALPKQQFYLKIAHVKKGIR